MCICTTYATTGVRIAKIYSLDFSLETSTCPQNGMCLGNGIRRLVAMRVETYKLLPLNDRKPILSESPGACTVPYEL